VVYSYLQDANLLVGGMLAVGRSLGVGLGWVGLGAISELPCPCLEFSRVVWAKAGIAFERAVESLRSIWRAAPRGGVSPPLNVLT